MFDLSGHTALVTGASGGIGSAIARALSLQGAKVVVSGTRLDALEDLKKELGKDCFIVGGNLADNDKVAGLVDEAAEASGSTIDILVNNAGITRDGLLMRMKDEDWDAVMEVNLKAAMILSRAVLKGMLKERWGRIIQISSIVGYTGNLGQANYAASKAGMSGFTKALASEVAARGITANMIAPGFIITPMTESLSDEQKEALLANVPSKRLGEAKEVASAVVYLASEEASYMTGATLHINGGMAML